MKRKNQIKKSLILDLDDTIFRTKSMDKKAFELFFDHLILGLQPHFSKETTNNIVNDLWKYTWDKVIGNYNIPFQTFVDSIRILESIELSLAITPYPDYSFIKNLPYQKFLVTTSLSSLQDAKIKALGIKNDFTKIVINDTFKEAKSKLDVFKELVAEYNLTPENTYVIGDNPDSEITAGNSLDMITIQILRDGVVKGDNAKHYIESFVELEEIFDRYNNAEQT